MDVFTLGYEGISILEYIDILKKNKIRLVCDVRNNAFSFKFGFSKKKFQEFLNKADIEYLHFPKLGVDQATRKKAGVSISRKRMFDIYKNVILKRPEALDEMDQILKLIKRKRKLVLTCFEKDHTDCHRSFLADALNKKTKPKFHVVHLNSESLPEE